MSRECYNHLYSVIISNIGEDQSKSEKYINQFYQKNYQSDDRVYIMYKAHIKGSGGYISGEVKLALTVQILAGGSPYDLAVIFGISPSRCKTIFIHVLVDWKIGTNIGKMNISEYMNDDEVMKEVAIGFSNRSNGVLMLSVQLTDGRSKFCAPQRFVIMYQIQHHFFHAKAFMH